MENYKLPTKVADVLVDEILEASDEEILQMCKEEGINASECVKKTKSIFEQIVNAPPRELKTSDDLKKPNAYCHDWISVKNGLHSK